MVDRRNRYGWARRFERRESQAASIWQVPALFTLGAFVLEGALVGLNLPTDFLGGLQAPGISTSSATSVLTAVAGSMMTVTGIVFSVMTLTVQTAGAAVSPRVVRTFYRDPVVKYSLGFFVGTFTYSVLLIVDIGYDDSGVALGLGMVLVLASVAVFLYMVNHVGQTLRTASMLSRVGRATRASMSAKYPEPLDDGPHDNDEILRRHALTYEGPPGAIMGINYTGIARWARRSRNAASCVVRVGDPLSPGDIVLQCERPPSPVLRWVVSNAVAIGDERAIDQDPAFGLRILVDAGCKALSPGVNDPTTATAALDHIDRILMDAGRRSLRLRVKGWLAGPGLDWAALVQMGLTEITWYGASSFQVTRRMSALLEHLSQLSASRQDAVRTARTVLERRVRETYSDPEDVRFALIPDPQGLSGVRQPSEGSGAGDDFIAVPQPASGQGITGRSGVDDGLDRHGSEDS